MKKSFLAALLCCTIYTMHAAGTRNAILLFDWDKETVANDFDRKSYSFFNQEFGPVTQSLLAGLHQQAAPIIVSATTWRNAVERGKIFDDIVYKRDISYLNKHRMLKSPANLQHFAQTMRQGYDTKRGLMYNNAGLTAVEYFVAYQTFYAKNPVFKPQEWIAKQLSDYLYLLIPKKYLNKLQASQDIPAIGRPLTTKLTPQERVLGMKFTKFNDIAREDLLNPEWHAGAFTYKNYTDLVPSSALNMIANLLRNKWHSILKGYFFGQHVNYMLAQLFVTHSDLRAPDGDRDETDINEAYFLHQWLIFMDGHGSVSDTGPVMPVVYTMQRGRWGTETRASIAYLAGLELGAFRQLLGFLNNRVRTGAFVYTSCYSGGQHLFKLYEHQWDYPIKGRRYTLARQDIFNYLIIATNLWYQVTQSSTFNYWSSGRYYQRLPGYRLQFDKFFDGLAEFLHPKPTKKPQDKYRKGRSSRPRHDSGELRDSNNLIVQLATVLKYVHSFSFENRWQVPAVRFPYTEWFVALDDPGVVVRLEKESERKAREAQERTLKQQLEALLKARKELPEIVQESIRKFEHAGMPPDIAERLVRDQEQKRKEEEQRKEKELFARMEQMRKEQEQREKATQPPKRKPPVYQEKKKPKGGVPVFPFGPSKRKNDVQPQPGPKPPKKKKLGPRRAPMTSLQKGLFKLQASLQQLGRALR